MAKEHRNVSPLPRFQAIHFTANDLTATIKKCFYVFDQDSVVHGISTTANFCGVVPGGALGSPSADLIVSLNELTVNTPSTVGILVQAIHGLSYVSPATFVNLATSNDNLNPSTFMSVDTCLDHVLVRAGKMVTVTCTYAGTVLSNGFTCIRFNTLEEWLNWDHGAVTNRK